MAEVLPTELFAHRASVAKANSRHLDALRSLKFTYTATDTGAKPHMLDSLLAEGVVELKLGAQVMLVKNVDEVLVNGLVGKVIGFYRAWELQTEEETGEGPTGRKPLSAIGSSTLNSAKKTVRTPVGQKKNAALMRRVKLDESGRVVKGVKDEGVGVMGENVKPENMADDGVKDADGKKKKSKAPSRATKQDDTQYPLVLFQYGVPGAIGGEVQTEAVLLKRDEFTVEDAEGKVLARRVQMSVDPSPCSASSNVPLALSPLDRSS